MTDLRPIRAVAGDLDLPDDALITFGRFKAKVDPAGVEQDRRGRLVLVSALTPTPTGEGKTTTSIGLAQGLTRLGERACLALREPSLGPCFGVKGGGTGGGRSKLEPSADINLHFNGDFHAVSAAHNLLAAMVDNHLHFGNELGLDTRRVAWPRVLDVNDRALRQIVVGLGGRSQGVPREASFDITAASEVMAVLCLARDGADLRARLDRLLVGFAGRKPVTAGDLGATGAMVALLKDALLPNLVQSTEGVPALVHGGPFANIAHGCNSVIATRLALRLADWVVTEAGFGMDLGGEKFFDIKCVEAGLAPSLVVLVATSGALKMHGGVALSELRTQDPGAVERGLANLEHHLATVRAFGRRVVVALNRRHTDTDEEVEVVRRACAGWGVPFAPADHFAQGGAGAVELARHVVAEADADPAPVTPLYRREDSVPDKLRAIARTAYGARDVVLTGQAPAQLRQIEAQGWAGLPVCVAKTQSSLTDDPTVLGRPSGFDVTVRELRVNAGAGFVVALTGELVRMPGLPKRPASLDVDVVDGEIVGVG